MPEVMFYHLQRQTLAEALPKLMEKVLQSGQKAVVRTADKVLMRSLDTALWVYDPDSFLPHGTEEHGDQALQPVFLTTGDDNPAGAGILVAVDGALPDDSSQIEEYDRLLYMFDGRDAAVVTKARADWKALKEKTSELSYWQQTETGGWKRAQ